MLASLRGGLVHHPLASDFAFPRILSTLLISALQSHLVTFKMFFNNNFTSINPRHHIPHNDRFWFNGYSLVTNDGPSTSGGFDLGAGIDGLSAAEIEDWWLAPKPDGNTSQYSGSTLLESFRNEFASPHNSQTGQTPEASGVDTGECYCNLSSVMDRVFNANNNTR